MDDKKLFVDVFMENANQPLPIRRPYCDCGGSGGGGGRMMLDGDLTIYVRKDGSDANDGLTDSPEGAFLTIQAAIDSVLRFDAQGYNVTVMVHGGSYSQPLRFGQSLNSVGFSNLYVRGFAGEVAEVTHDTAVQALVVVVGCIKVTLCDLTVTANTQNPATYMLQVFASSSTLDCSNIALRYVGSTNAIMSLFHASMGQINLSAPINIDVTKCNAVFSSFSGLGRISQRSTVNHQSALTVSSAYARAISGGTVNLDTDANFSGAAVTGKRYNAESNGIIYSAGRGATFVPGSVAGTTTSGGVYV